MRELGVGVIGAGFMGQTYARTVNILVHGARLTAVAEGSRAPVLAAQYGIPCCVSFDELVARQDVDFVCIATPHACHASHALAAVRAGKHVLIDKPMATRVEDCDAIIAECKTSNLKCSVTFTQRRRIGFVKAQEAVAALGRVLETRSCQIVPNGLSAVPKWQLSEENVGILMGHGIHNIDGVRAITGREIHSVFAKCRSLSGAPVEATSDLLLTLDDGSVHYIFCSFEVSKPGFPRSEVGMRIVCERGLVDLDPYGETRVSVDGQPWEVMAVQPPIDWAGKGFLDPVRLQTYSEILQDLVDAIHEDREPAITAWDGRQAVAGVVAAYKSSEMGHEVFLEHGTRG